MSTSSPDPAYRLATLLETLPSDEREQIVAFLLGQAHAVPPAALAPMIWPGGHPETRLRGLAAALPAGEDSQLVTIRLPAERHGELRDWCAEHNFTMAAVVRGLIERFLEQQQVPGAPVPEAG